MIPTYPSNFTCPNWNYSDSTEGFVNQALFDCGWQRQRRQWHETSTSASFEFDMDTYEYANWSRWAEASGYAWFYITLGGETLQARFRGNIDYSYGPHDSIVARVGAEVRR